MEILKGRSEVHRSHKPSPAGAELQKTLNRHATTGSSSQTTTFETS